MKLSDRLQAVADCVTENLIVADIGTDHGYVPIYLVLKGICNKAYAMDINEGPILRAREHIIENGLENKIETRISNGFEKLGPGEAECAVIAGMGGELMVTILKEGIETVQSLQELVLSPHSEIVMVRKYLHQIGFKIIAEKMLIDDGKFYTVIKAAQGGDRAYSEIEYKYGALLIEEKNEILLEYLIKEKHKIDTIISGLEKNNTENAKNRRRELVAELEGVEDLIKQWQ